jgi:hypothetical protein
MADDDDGWRDVFRAWRRPLEANGIYRGMDLARIAMEQVIEGKRRAADRAAANHTCCNAC